MASDPEGGQLFVHERFIIRRLRSLAHLVVIVPGAAWTRTNELGKVYSVFDGAMRIWWPGFSTDDPPPRHRRPWHITDDERDCEGERPASPAEKNRCLLGPASA